MADENTYKPNKHAQKLGRRGGKNSRKYMSPEQASEIARKANQVRHKKNPS